MPPTRLPRKKDVALALLEQSSVFVHLDPRDEKVRVPAWFKKQPQLVLQIGLNMAIPIKDLQVDEEGLSCTLSFNRSPHHCAVPWGSVYALVGEDGRGMVWPDDVPPEVAAQMQQKAAPKPKLAAVGQAAETQGPKKPALAARSTKQASTPNSPAAARPQPAAVKNKAPAVVAPVAKAAEPKKKRTCRKPAEKAEASKALVPVAQVAREGDKDSEAPSSGKPKRELPPYLRVIK